MKCEPSSLTFYQILHISICILLLFLTSDHEFLRQNFVCEYCQQIYNEHKLRFTYQQDQPILSDDSLSEVSSENDGTSISGGYDEALNIQKSIVSSSVC